MQPCPKDKPYRNQKLLDLASEAPHCMYCKEPNNGQVVACHSNSQKFGKGMGQRASDAPIALMCGLCHSLYDGRIGPHLTQQERDLIFYEAACKTWEWLMKEGHLEVRA